MGFLSENVKKQQSFRFLKFVFCSLLLSLSFFIIVLVFLVGLYFVDSIINVNRNDSLKKPLFGAYIIVSQSMVPTIKVNDAIVVKRIDNDDYKVGDVITFSSSDINYKGLNVTHRIVKKEIVSENSSIYTTKGDNNPIVDSSLVSTNAIYGKVLFRIPRVGNVKDFFSKPANCFATLLIPSVVFIFYEIIRILHMLLITKRC